MAARIAMVMLMAALALPTTGCARFRSALTPEPEVVTIEATVAVAGAAVEGELPEGTPADLPLWPGSTVVEGESGPASYTLTLSATDTFDDVLAGLAKGFSDAGWEVAQEDLGEGAERTAVLTVEGSSGQGIVTLTAEDDGSVMIVYVISPA
jgi:hypothetical protein